MKENVIPKMSSEKQGSDGKELNADQIVYNIPWGHEIQARKTGIGNNRSQVSQFEDVTLTGEYWR